MVQALIQFTQGAVVGGDGVALIVTTTGGSVTAANVDDTGVVAWAWELLSAPPPSAVSLATAATPTAAMPQPDVAGSYRVSLTVRDAAGNTDRDIRCYGVPFPNGIVCPPYQDNPRPLPYGVKPAETNYGGTAWGWMGDDGDPRQLYGALKLIGGASSGIVPIAVDIALTANANTVLDTRPSTPSGSGRWKLVSIDLRMKTAITGGGSVTLSVGSTSGGVQVVIPQTLTGSTAVGTIVGGLALTSLGTDMSQTNGFEAMYGAAQAIYGNVAVTGTVTTGVATAYLVWQSLP